MLAPGAKGSGRLLLDERFSLETSVAAGGMGEVYVGTDRLTGEPVAVKLLRVSSPALIERATREAATLASLSHPAIVRYVGHGVMADGRVYIAMEWLVGETLEQRLLRGPLSALESIRLLRRVTEGLTVAHTRGVVHRDLKPSNLFLVNGAVEETKILDFGIAARILDQQRLTRSGVMLGTPAYMSPEQARGQKDIDATTDVFSLGAVLYECLAGQAPFRGENLLAVAAEVCLQDPPRLRDLRADLPSDLDALLMTMLAKEPSHRPRDARELARALAQLGEPTAAVTTPTSLPVSLAEQRVLSVVLIGGVDTSEDTRVEDDAGASFADMPRVLQVLEPFAGRAERLTKGSAIAYFETASAPTDLATRAVRFALALVAELKTARVVVCTGRGVLSRSRPIGEVVDRGAPLLEVTEPGIRLDEVTAELVAARFLLEQRPWGALLVAERDVDEGPRMLLGRKTPFVGRNRELRFLESLVDECVDESAARAALVVAPPGMGKSRLRHELVAKLTGDDARFDVLAAHGDSMRSGVPFSLLASMVRALASVTGEDSLAARQGKLSAVVARAVAPASVRRVTEFLGEIAGISFPSEGSPALMAARQDPRLMGEQMKTAWLEWLGGLLALHPTLLVLDDLHWGDKPSVQLLDAAMRAFHDQAFAILAFARPEVQERFASHWAGWRLETIQLQPLTLKASRELVSDILEPHLDANLVERLVERANGNAFFLEELMRSVAAGRAELPDTVMAMVQIHLEALGLEACRLLRAASVFGDSFRIEGIGALLPECAPRVPAHLQLIEDRELIVATPGSHGGYAFRHALVRETCYAALTPEDRALGHRLAGSWLEGSNDVDAFVLAEHFYRGEEHLRAAAWYGQAAVNALRGNDAEAAIAAADRGVNCGAGGAVLAQLRLVQALVHGTRGDFTRAEEAALDAVRNAEAGTALWYDAVRELVTAAGEQAKIDVQREWTLRAAATEPHLSARSAQIACLSWAAGGLSDMGDNPLAGRLLETCEKAAALDQALEPWVSCRFHLARGLYRTDTGQVDGLYDLTIAVSAAEETGDTWMMCFTRLELGVTLAENGCADIAREVMQGAVEDARRQQLPEYVQMSAESSQLYHLLHLGLAEEGRALALPLLERAGRQDSPRLVAGAGFNLARCENLLGDYGSAVVHAREVVALWKDIRTRSPPARAVLARALLGVGERAEALRESSQALRELELVGNINRDTTVFVVAAEALWANGQVEQACSVLRRVRDEIVSRAAAISDPELRKRYLSNVDEHRRLFALAQSWGLAG